MGLGCIARQRQVFRCWSTHLSGSGTQERRGIGGCHDFWSEDLEGLRLSQVKGLWGQPMISGLDSFYLGDGSTYE